MTSPLVASRSRACLASRRIVRLFFEPFGRDMRYFFPRKASDFNDAGISAGQFYDIFGVFSIPDTAPEATSDEVEALWLEARALNEATKRVGGHSRNRLEDRLRGNVQL